MYREADDILWLPRGFEFLSGLPEAKRRRRMLMPFQAFIDDSGSKGQGLIMVLAGVMGTAETMALVSENWDRELRAKIPLPIRYFKTHEARTLQGEFSDWSRKKRDEKVKRMAAVIDREDLVMVYSSVDLASHRTMEGYIGHIPDSTKHPYNQPYLLALPSVMITVAKEMWHRKLDEKVEVIFDEQFTYKADAKLQWAIMREETKSEWLTKYMPSEPLFRDDMDFVILQAADLVAGHTRMVAERASRWPQLTFDKLMGSPFNQPHWAKPLAHHTRGHIARLLGVSPEALPIKWSPKPPPGES